MFGTDRLPTLDAPRVVLRWMEERDAEALFGIFSDPEVMRYWSSPPMEDLADAQNLLADVRTKLRRKTYYQWGIARREDDRVIGTCTLFHLDLDNRRGEIGYALGREHWGQGYMAEALGALLTLAFQGLGLHRLEADVDPGNTGSIKTLERLGFQKEGYLRERWIVDGRVMDTLLFGLLRREWPGPWTPQERRP